MTSDASLILRARGGDEGAWAELAKRYDNFIRFIASTYFLPGGEIDDLVQEGFHGLFKAVRDYRPDRGSGFANFADGCIRRQVITAVKTATRKKHGPLNEYVSFASQSCPTAGDESELRLEEALPSPPDHDPAERLCEHGDLTLLGEGLKTMTKLERSVCLRLADGLSYEDVAGELGVSIKTVDNATQRAKRKLAGTITDAPAEEETPLKPTVDERIEAFLWQHPGSTVKQIAEGIGSSHHYVRERLNAGWPGLTKAKATPNGKRWCWYMFRRGRAAA